MVGELMKVLLLTMSLFLATIPLGAQSPPQAEEVMQDPIDQQVTPTESEQQALEKQIEEAISESHSDQVEEPSKSFNEEPEGSLEEDSLKAEVEEAPPTQEQKVDQVIQETTPEKQEYYGETELQPGEKRIRHPWSKKGLIRITKDKTYVYKTKKSKANHSTTVLMTTYSPTALETVVPDKGTIQYSDIYDDGFMFTFDYEWVITKNFGRLGLKLGSGLMIAQGNGRLRNDLSKTALESFTLFMFPNKATAIYRMQYWGDNQILVPYVEGGGGYYTFLETRDDNLGPKPGRMGGAAMAEWAVGGSLNLGALNKDAVLTLDREYGINNLWFNVEYRSLIGLKADFDLSADLINIGFMMEY